MYHYTVKSTNPKTGPITTTVSPRENCPTTCEFKGNGCYAENFPLSLHWKKVSEGKRGTSWKDFLAGIKREASYIWRHNVAGDLAHKNGRINAKQLRELTEANDHRRGFTYTHHRMDMVSNYKAVREANRNGFTVNVSASTFKEAVKLNETLPTVVVGPIDFSGSVRIDGTNFVTCPAVERDDINCEKCKLCTMANRSSVVVFPSHGARKKAAEAARKVFEIKLVA